MMCRSVESAATISRPRVRTPPPGTRRRDVGERRWQIVLGLDQNLVADGGDFLERQASFVGLNEIGVLRHAAAMEPAVVRSEMRGRWQTTGNLLAPPASTGQCPQRASCTSPEASRARYRGRTGSSRRGTAAPERRAGRLNLLRSAASAAGEDDPLARRQIVAELVELVAVGVSGRTPQAWHGCDVRRLSMAVA